MSVLICDTECYINFWLIAFKRVRDSKIVSFELSDRSEIDLEKLRAIMTSNRIVTYNGNSYDIPMTTLALTAAPPSMLKSASDRIIQGGMKPWDVEREFGIRIPKLDHIDLIEPQPNPVIGLKGLNGRMHGKRMQDLPIEPDARLTHADMDALTAYCVNDLDATHLLYECLAEPLALREALGAEYKQDFMSKSDSQIGEAIVKKRVEQVTGTKVAKVVTPGGTSFRYNLPPWLAFATPQMREILAKVAETDFIVRYDGKVDLPAFLNRKVQIGSTTYAMGIGGLHSTEAAQMVLSDAEHQLIDFDVASYYPAIILGSGLYPKSLGPAFLDVYRKIRDDRVAAKRRTKEIDGEIAAMRFRPAVTDEDKRQAKRDYLALVAEQNSQKIKAEGLKISLNGCFGKLGSPYSVLYAPHLMIAVTLTGQLALLMLIERVEQAGIPAVSGNTDGVVFRCPVGRMDELLAITKQWEADTGFELEATKYRALYSASVNEYIAIKEDGKAKRKGPIANPLTDKDMRGQLMKNPQMGICSDAVVALLTEGTPIADTIHACRDIRQFVTVVKVTGGATWRGEYLGKVVRFVWGIDGDVILKAKPHPSTGNFAKVSKSDGARPLMTLPDEWPVGLIDYDRYIEEAEAILVEIGHTAAPPPVPKVKKPTVAEARILAEPVPAAERAAHRWFALCA